MKNRPATVNPIQLSPDDPTPDGPFKDDDWFRFYGPDPGSETGTTHFEVHELCTLERCNYRDEPCPWHVDDCARPVGVAAQTCVQRLAAAWILLQDLCPGCTRRTMAAVESLGEMLEWHPNFTQRAQRQPK